MYYRIGAGGKKYYGKKGAGILYTDGTQILLLKRADGDQKGAWGLPGGKAEEEELDIDTATRETKEECGVLTGQRIGKFEEYDNKFKWTTFIYKINKPFKCKLSNEHSDYKWVRIEEMDKLKLHTKFEESLPTYVRAIKKQFSSQFSKKLDFKEFFDSL